jgi:signal transduction histidine kinase/CheY-like chemotaxis protein
VNRPAGIRYGIAIATFVVAALLRWALMPVFGSSLPYITFYPAIMVTAWYGGLAPGLLTTAMGAIAVLALWPAGGLGAASLISVLSVTLYVTNGTAISGLTELLHRARRRQEIFREAAVAQEREIARLLGAEQEARAIAEAANRAKDDFLAMLSHELRTPLTAIIGWIGVLRRQRFEDERLGYALDVIGRNAHTQRRLVDDLLDVSRIVAGKSSLEKLEVDLLQVVEDGVEDARESTAAKSLTIATRLEAADPCVLGDPHRLQQVVANLLSNAIKFTPPGGRIDVELERRDAHVRLVVRDTGEGIAPEDLSRIFGRFEQGAASFHAHRGGLGLGLAISRHLVEAHGGVIRAESAGRGQGAAFSVELPVLAVRVGAGPVSAASPRHFRATADAMPGLEGLGVLVVDDHADARETIGMVLRQSGADVRLAGSAPEALVVLSHAKIDVLVSDLGMPTVDGYALMRHVRAMERASARPAVTAVAVSAYAGQEYRDRALSAGFDAHAGKPVDPHELLAVIASARSRGVRDRAGCHG